MARSFDLDTTAAENANSGGKRITEPGVYTGTFRAAWYEQNDKGTESVHLIFHSDAGQEAGPLALYTHRGDGTELPSYKALNAIMACANLRKLTVQRGRVKLWDSAAGQEVEKEKDTYPALVGPRIGLVLQGEEYESRDGDVKQRLVIAAPFDAETRKMADEVLSRSADAIALDRFMKWFENGHQVKRLKASRPTMTDNRSTGSPSSFVDDDLSDIPF